jgi:hypothetical protein
MASERAGDFNLADVSRGQKDFRSKKGKMSDPADKRHSSMMGREVDVSDYGDFPGS